MSLSSKSAFPVDGGCVCGHIRYRMTTLPMVTHCCFCTWCQRESGSAFNLHAMMEPDRVELLTPNKPRIISIPTLSGEGQNVACCPECFIPVWCDYNSGGSLRWIKVGTLDRPDACPPDVFIFTENKQSWVDLPASEKTLSFSQNYDNKEKVWPKQGLERLETLMAKSKGTE